MKRSIFVVILIPLLAFGISFKDVPVNHWAYDAVNEVSELGIISGYPDGTFRGVDFVNRYQLAVAIYRTIEYIKSQMKNFSPPGNSKEVIQPQVISEIKSNISDLEEKYKMMTGYVNKKYKDLYEKISSLERKISENTLEISKNKASVDRLNDSLIYEDSRITKIATSVLEISKEVNDHSKHLKSLDDSVDKLEKAYSIFTDYVNDVKESINVVKETLDSSISEFGDELNTVKRISGENSLALKKLRADLIAVSSRTSNLEKFSENASNSILILEKSLSKLQSKIDDLDDKCDSLYAKERTDFQNLSEKIGNNESSIEDLKNSLSGLEDRVSNVLEPELSKTKSDILKMEKRVSDIEEISKDFVKKEVFQKKMDDVENKLDQISRQLKNSSNTDIAQWVLMMMLVAALGGLIYIQMSGGSK